MYKVVVLNPVGTMAKGIISSLAAMAQKYPDILDCVAWNPTSKPIFDMFDECSPDFIYAEENMLPNIGAALKEFYKAKVILIDNIFENKIVADLRCLREDTSEVIKKNSDAKKLITIAPAANYAVLNRGEYKARYEVDTLYYASTPHPVDGELDFLAQLENTAYEKNSSIRMIGFHRPFISYIGQVSAKSLSDYMRSAKQTVTYDENIMWDIRAQRGKAAYKNIAIADNEDILFEEALNNTFFHRVSDIFKALKHKDLADLSLKVLEELKEDFNV